MTADRSLAYALFSELTASPADQRGLARPRTWRTLPGQVARICGQLPYPLDVTPLVRSLRGALRGDRAEALRAYGGLFEVGSKGPPVPIREDFTRLDALNVLEEIVRFYDYFGYRLDDQCAWLAGHLAVELEFLQLLTYQARCMQPITDTCLNAVTMVIDEERTSPQPAVDAEGHDVRG